MTNLDHKHLDALVERQRQIAILHRGIIESHKDTIRGPLSLSVAEHRELIADASRAADAITALRAENDRLSNLWQIEHDHATALRALHTDDTRAAMDAIRRDGYEAGCDATMRAMLATQLPRGPDYRKFWWLVQYVLQPSMRLQLATGSATDPDATQRK